jgi:hypothetical protein
MPRAVSGLLGASLLAAWMSEILVGALGCNIAWGIIEGFFYLWGLQQNAGANEF